MTDAALHTQRLDDQVVVSLHGEIDLENAARVREKIARSVPRAASRVVVDLSEVVHLDSAGVRLLFDLAARLDERRHDLAIVVARDSLLREVVDVVRLDRVATVVDTVDDALRLPARPPERGTAVP